MRIARGPRPWTIWAFTVSILVLAAFKLGFSLADLPLIQIKYELQFPWIEWDRNLSIVASFTELTIALIPLVWITLFAARFARWFILCFGIWTMLSALASLWGGLFFGDRVLLRAVEPALIATTLCFLFLPATSRWLAGMKYGDDETFA